MSDTCACCFDGHEHLSIDELIMSQWEHDLDERLYVSTSDVVQYLEHAPAGCESCHV